MNVLLSSHPVGDVVNFSNMNRKSVDLILIILPLLLITQVPVVEPAVIIRQLKTEDFVS